MADREKVMKGLECCVSSNTDCDCPEECPYYEICWDDHDGTLMGTILMSDALELLKEQQEPIKPYLSFDGHDIWRCGNCHTTIYHCAAYEPTDLTCEKKYAQYCRHCGRRVKWDDQETQAETDPEDHPVP